MIHSDYYVFIGYEDLIRQGYPLPSIRTLARRTQHIKLEPGLFQEVINLLGEKLENSPEQLKLFSLTLDEMSLKSGSGIDYDLKTDSYIGNVTLPDHKGPASKALVFQLASITGPRVKQVIGYHFTPGTYNFQVFIQINCDPFFLQLIKKYCLLLKDQLKIKQWLYYWKKLFVCAMKKESKS